MMPLVPSITFPLDRSSVVEKVLLQAQEDGKNFSVIVVDSKPLLEGTDHNLLIHLSTNFLSRQSTFEGLDGQVKSNTLYLCVTTGIAIPLDGSDDSFFGCPFPVFKWSGIFSGRYRHGGYDGKSAQRTCRCLL